MKWQYGGGRVNGLIMAKKRVLPSLARRRVNPIPTLLALAVSLCLWLCSGILDRAVHEIDFLDHAIKAIHGKTTQASAVPAIASWIDYEFHTRSGRMQNNWTSAMARWWDGTGWQASGGYCETTSTTYTTVLRSAGIPARPIHSWTITKPPGMANPVRSERLQ